MRSAETQGDEVRRCSLIILKKIKNPMLHKTASDLNLAEGEGFEPSIRNFRMPPFQGGTFNHSATLPRWSELTVSSESAIVQYIFKVV